MRADAKAVNLFSLSLSPYMPGLLDERLTTSKEAEEEEEKKSGAPAAHRGASPFLAPFPPPS
jgi:hypothetical protein